MRPTSIGAKLYPLFRTDIAGVKGDERGQRSLDLRQRLVEQAGVELIALARGNPAHQSLRLQRLWGPGGQLNRLADGVPCPMSAAGIVIGIGILMEIGYLKVLQAKAICWSSVVSQTAITVTSESRPAKSVGLRV